MGSSAMTYRNGMIQSCVPVKKRAREKAARQPPLLTFNYRRDTLLLP
jgi:hypothetical protein